MMNVAASGGYYISLPSDWIIAHPTTITGSIGVIFARPGFSGFMEKYGFAMQVNKSGEQKDMGSPFRPPTEADQVIFQSLTDTLADRFLGLVQKHRNLKPDQREQIASARIYLADDAKKLGLVDQIGYLTDAIDKARSLAGLNADARVVTFPALFVRGRYHLQSFRPRPGRRACRPGPGSQASCRTARRRILLSVAGVILMRPLPSKRHPRGPAGG